MKARALVILSLSALPGKAAAPAADRNTPSCTLEMEIGGVVAPGTFDYLSRGFARAAELDCRSVLLRINTPGGNLQTTRMIVERILSSPVPVLCLVGPPGGHAGSAGAIILMACHVAGAEPATNIGAATPVSGTGAEIAEDLRKKLVQDTESWVRGLAKLRGRNLEVAGKIVTEARALDAEDAAKLGVIDVVTGDVDPFLDFAEGRQVKMPGGATAVVRTGALMRYQPDLRHDLLQILTDPQFAYLLFMASLALLYFEFTHPGIVVPGVAGGIGLIVSLMAFHKLNVWWGGASLIVLGVVLLAAEAFVPSFGALGFGGIVAFAVGSVLLYDPSVTGSGLPLSLIAVTTGTVGALMLGLAFLAYKTRHRGRAIMDTALLERVGEIASLEAPSLRRGMVIIEGEYWKFSSERDVRVGDRVVVTAQKGLTLVVKPAPVDQQKTINNNKQ